MIFNRRNRIAHAGESDFTAVEAEECFSATEVLLVLLMEMDAARAKKLQQEMNRT